MSITHTTAARLKWVKNRKYHISCIFLCDQIHSFIRTETFSFFCATKSTTPPLSLSSNVGVGPERKLPHLLQIAAGGIGNLLPGEVSSFRNISKNFQNTSNIQNIINGQIYIACMEWQKCMHCFKLLLAGLSLLSLPFFVFKIDQICSYMVKEQVRKVGQDWVVYLPTAISSTFSSF